MKRIVLVRHGEEPGDDRVTTFFRARGFEPEIRKPFQGEALGDVDSTVVASVIFGGPFNVFEEDRFPFLHDENRWIEQCMKRDVPLLGICQGAQSMARVLGAEVGPKETGVHEFGYYEVEATPEGQALFPGRLVVAQAHSHGFEIPHRATRLASGALFENQAFSYGPHTLGLQFHAEVTPHGFRRWQDAKWAAYGRPGAQTREQQDQLMAQHDAAQAAWFNHMLEQFFGPALGGD